MSNLKEYSALQDFTISLDNGKTSLYVKRGEILQFDGLNVILRGEQGTARSLSKVVGEWIALTGISVKPVEKQLASVSRNATGGRVVEHSDYTSDPLVGIQNPPSDSIDKLLKGYDKIPEIKMVNGKREVTSDLDDIKREVTVVNEDANEVRKVSAYDGAPVTNKDSVAIGSNTNAKSATLSHEGNVAKATNYTGKQASTEDRKKLTIDYESSGVEVRKTSNNKGNVAKAPVKMETFATDVEVAGTSYPSTQTTDVGSSTQAQMEQHKISVNKAPVKKAPAKKAPAKKAPVKKAPAKITSNAPIMNVTDSVEELIDSAPIIVATKPTVAKGVTVITEGQEAVVISKVSRDTRSSIQTEDGITSRVTVGASGEVDAGEVTFSSNNDFEEPTAVYSSGEDTPFDASEAEVIYAKDDDIDLNDLLAEV
jgi:hypothetical protein